MVMLEELFELIRFRGRVLHIDQYDEFFKVWVIDNRCSPVVYIYFSSSSMHDVKSRLCGILRLLELE